METVLYIAIFVLGTIIGSFLNVVILRYNTGKGVGGRSMCFTCGHELKWSDLVPLFSYLILGGRCVYCKSKISIQYPIVEALTGIAFVLIALKVSFIPILALYLTAFSLLLVIAVYDYIHKIIPDGIVFSLIFLGLLRIVINYLELRGDITMDIVSGLGIFFFFAFLWFVSGGKWMGFGDAKLGLAVGWLLPFCQNISAIVLSFFVGSIVGLSAIAIMKSYSSFKKRQFKFDPEIPFAPFIIFSVFVSFVFNFDIIGILMGGMMNCISF